MAPPRPSYDTEENTLKADAFSQLRLLDVQELDSVSAERAEIHGQVQDAKIRVDDLSREQRKADADVEQVKTRRTRDRERMDRGQISNPKDLERMQHELVALDRRISDLEDLELEVMEQLEVAQGEHAALSDRQAALDDRAATLVESRDRTAAALQEDLGTVTAERERTATGLAEPLLTLYDRLRGQRNGVGAAALRARRCTGCSLQLTASDLGAIAAAPEDEVLRCEECDRILVRTTESGL